MPTFTLGGVSYEYVVPAPPAAGKLQSWEYGHWPRVEAAVPLTGGGGTVAVYAEASRWGADVVHVRWEDDAGHYHQAWVPKENVRRLTASEWDIIQFHACPENLLHIQWGKRMPGFLPE